MDAREFQEWRAFARLAPFDETRGDLRAGIIASTLANAHAALRETILACWIKDYRPEHEEPFTPDDFMPRFGQPKDESPAPADEDEMILAQQHFFESLVSGMGGKVVEYGG